jgi:hypothetical protein
MKKYSSASCLTLILALAGNCIHPAHAASGPPVITAQPASLTVLEGDPASFSVTVDGTPPFAYQWRRNGGPISNATNVAYTIGSATAGDHLAVFSVVVTNPSGSTTSSNATLRVDPGATVTNTVTFISMGDTWRYHQAGTDLGTAWSQPAYDDSASPWLAGAGVFDVKTSGARTTIGGETIRTTLSIDSTPGTHVITHYFRARFNFSTQNVVSVRFRVQALVDDGFAAYLNGQELVRAGIIPAALSSDWANRTIGDATIENFADLPGTLFTGTNVLAAELHQINNTSSDSTFGMSLTADVVTRVRDTVPPSMQQRLPTPNSTVKDLDFISVTFDEPVTGVDAGDLRINGVPATGLFTVSAREYQFTFPQPGTGAVSVAWAPGHGIFDLASTPNAFAGGSWAFTWDPNAVLSTLIISEIMAENDHGITDEDGTRADWIEIYNPGPLDVNLGGWFLTDAPLNPTKWRFPSLNLAANRYLLVWASEKDRTNPAAPLHTNFKLENGGEFLALIDPRTNLVSAFVPIFPPQQADISYGRDRVDPSLLGYFTTPTPGAQNSTSGQGFASDPVFSVDSGVYTNNTLSVALSTRAGTIRYTTDGTVPTTSSPIYSTPITVSANTTIKARVFQTGLWPSKVGAKTYILLDASAAAFSSNLPLLIMNTSGSGIVEGVPPGQPRTRGSLVVIDPGAGRATLLSPPDFQGVAEFEIFGQTSAGFPKKPYNIEIQDELGNDRAISLLGMPAEADWKLRNPYSDKCMMNDFLGYELYEKMGHYQVRRRFVEVFVDTSGGKVTYPGDYHGILVLLEKIERGKDRVDIAELTPSHTNEPAISGGYMFKKDKDSAGDINFSTSGGGGFSGQGLKMHEPKPGDVTTAQVSWLQNHLNRFESALYAANWLTATGTNHYSHYIDVDSFVDQHWIVEFTKQIDGYRLSSYFSKDRGGKIKWEPIWDWNLSFGNADYADGFNTSNWYYHQCDQVAHIWIRRMITGTTASTSTTGDPDFNQKMIDRWSVLRTNVFNATNVNARVDELAAYLSEAAARDFAKFPRLGTYIWPNPPIYSTPTTYAGIITNMKAWILGRYLWIESLYTPTPVLNHPGGQVGSGFRLGLSVPSGSTVYFTLDGSDPRLPGGGISPLAQTYSASITVTNNIRAFARALRGTSWSGPAVATLYTSVPSLRITEIMYHPSVPAGDTNDPGNFEFIEIANAGSSAVSLIGARLGGGIDFVFTAASGVTNLAPGARALVVKNRAAFVTRYPALAALVAGEFSGSLDNAGDHIVFTGSVAEPILDFRYENSWYPLSDGSGFSLVVMNESAPVNSWTNATQWRHSAFDGGSPGQSDPAPASIQPVLVNEVLTHPILPEVDAIELHNPNPAPANVGYWYLSDSPDSPRKYRLPSNTVIPAYGFLALYETNTFNSTNTALDPFGLSSGGDDIYLFSADSTGRLTGYAHGFDFGPAAPGVSFGRYVTSVGADHFVAQSAITLSSTNAYPVVGPVVIGEFMFYPPELMIGGIPFDNTRDEFVEIRNITDEPVPLFDPARPANTWKVEEAVDFSFPSNAVLAANAFALVVGFDPVADLTSLSAFRSRYGLSTNVPIFGPFDGRLNNSAERLELRRPGLANPVTGAAPMVLVDRVDYAPLPPWSAAGGTGASIQRRNLTQYGNDPNNWLAAGPTPGLERTPGEPPVITSAPQPQAIKEGESAAFTVAVSGTGPFLYQWYWNGQPIDGAFNPALVLTNVLLPQTGDYSVYVLSSSGSVMSSPARLTVIRLPEITVEPLDQKVNPGTDVTLFVGATGTGIITYQWQFNGSDLAGANDSTLVLTNVQLEHSGLYRAVVSDPVGTRTSREALVFVLVRPTLVRQPGPTNQMVVLGDDAAITVEATGALPLSYRWRKNNATYVSNGVATLAFPSVSLADAGYYDVIVTNLAGGTGASGSQQASARAYLLVVAPPISQGALSGSDVTFRAIVSSPGPMTNRYCWIYNSSEVLSEGTSVIPTSTARMFTNDLVLTGVTPGRAGTYTFVVSNSLVVTNLVSTNVYPASQSSTAALVVGDTTPPSLTCPGNLAVSTDPGQCTANPAYAPVANDSGGVAGTACVPAGPYPLGLTTVTCRAWDVSGNSNSCSFTITVTDGQGPTVAGCPGPQTLTAGATCTVPMPDFRTLVMASDNCGTPVLTQVPAPGTQVGAGVRGVTITARDGAGNSNGCSFTLTVADTQAPAVTGCPGAQTVTAGESGTAALPDLRSLLTATDNCGTPTLTQAPAPGTTVGAGTNTVTITARDAAGNTVICQTTVIVEVPVTEIRLAVELAGTNAIIRWPESPAGWTLQEASVLTSPPNWQTSGATRALQGGQWRATVPVVEGTNKYFRLQKP